MKEKTEEKIGKVLENRQINFLYRTYLLFSEHKMKVYSGYAALYILMAMIPLLMLIIFFINRFSPIGVDTFIEVGVGKTLAGLIKRINGGVNVYKVENSADLEALNI